MMDEIKNEIKGEINNELEKEWKKEKRKNPQCDHNRWWEERRLGMKIVLGILMGIGVIGLIFLFGWIVMLLWNWLMPEIFGLKEVTYWQAWGLLLLSSILFKGFPSNSNGNGGKRGDRKRRKELRKIMDKDSVVKDIPE